jgi:hypothetical protein
MEVAILKYKYKLKLNLSYKFFTGFVVVAVYGNAVGLFF